MCVHLGDDVCKFNVPEFLVDQHMRIRVKIHTKKNKAGYCVLSITASCKPKNIESLRKSTSSLDSIGMLPSVLTYVDE